MKNDSFTLGLGQFFGPNRARGLRPTLEPLQCPHGNKNAMHTRA